MGMINSIWNAECMYCGRERGKSEEWPVRYCCRECALAAKEKYDFGDGWQEKASFLYKFMVGEELGVDPDVAKDKVKKMNRESREKVVKKLEDEGQSREVIRKGWRRMGIIGDDENVYGEKIKEGDNQ